MEAGNDRLNGTALDLSLGGALVQSHRAFPTGTLITVSLSLSRKSLMRSGGKRPEARQKLSQPARAGREARTTNPSPAGRNKKLHNVAIRPANRRLPFVPIWRLKSQTANLPLTQERSMKLFIAFLATFLALISTQPIARAAKSQTLAPHDRAFWRNILKDNYRVPQGQSAFPLIQELTTYLGSPDPEFRDDIAYTLIDAWIAYQKQLSAPELVRCWMNGNPISAPASAKPTLKASSAAPSPHSASACSPNAI